MDIPVDVIVNGPVNISCKICSKELIWKGDRDWEGKYRYADCCDYRYFREWYDQKDLFYYFRM